MKSEISTFQEDQNHDNCTVQHEKDVKSSCTSGYWIVQ